MIFFFYYLQSILGNEYRVHPIELNYYGSHIDTSIVALRPGLLLCNPERVQRSMLPDFLQDWEIIYSPDLVEHDFVSTEYDKLCFATKWIWMNVLSISPDLAVVDKKQVELIRLLEHHKINVAPLELRHAQPLGGGFHCVTVDVRRRHT